MTIKWRQGFLYPTSVKSKLPAFINSAVTLELNSVCSVVTQQHRKCCSYVLKCMLELSKIKGQKAKIEFVRRCIRMHK